MAKLWTATIVKKYQAASRFLQYKVLKTGYVRPSSSVKPFQKVIFLKICSKCSEKVLVRGMNANNETTNTNNEYNEYKSSICCQTYGQEILYKLQ
ncbi:hypothetical protein SpiGrapes_0750 [Sphaerochaeta pleomorpha str. Grapes]|uniref:Uncharacterized protein n=1 Tax=Sphaerochaeta pleomorpha (strain ATCC BAA-1885 / DSM 22778 / Grapes) TaxID=158190 RepID=G8QYM2_SPHPG|nr:hypothetical protein SpiGrapes_0750 [Sphaerochaeta pleomorpha str. Grapes]